MAYEFLKKLFGEPKEGDQPTAMTYEQLESAINAANLSVVNIKDGGYVSKDKFDAKVNELSGVKSQLEAANTQIQSFKGQETSVEAANQKVAEWEEKYKADTEKLQQQLTSQARSHAEEMFLSGYQFTSKAARQGVLDEFRKQQFTLDDDGQFRGAKEYIDSLMKQDDYKGAFVIAEPDGGKDDGGAAGNTGNGGPAAPQQHQPYFSAPTQGAPSGINPTQNPFSGLASFQFVNPPKNNQNGQTK